MALLVALVGVVIILLGLAGLRAPQRIVDELLSWQPRSRYCFAAGSRLAFGAVLLTAASDCRFATVIFALGALAVGVSLVLVPLGVRRVDSIFQWWLHRPAPLLRGWLTAAIPFGAFLVYAGL